MSDQKRTKEQLIAVRSKPDTGTPWGAPACLLASGQIDTALDMLVQHTGMQWRHNALFHFDLRKVDDQGRLLADGEMPLRPRAFKVSVPPENNTPADAAAGVLSLSVGVEAAPPMLTWKTGEHLDDVLARGAERVTERAREAIQRRVDAIPLNLSEQCCCQCGTCGTWATGVVLCPSCRAPRVEKMRVALREVGYDVVPLLRRADLRTWLLSIGFKDTERPGVVQHNSFETVINWRGAEEMETLPCEDNTIASVASCLGMQARAVRDAIQRHVEEQRSEHASPGDRSTYNVATDHDSALRAAGYNPEAMTTDQIVDAMNRGLLSGFGPEWVAKRVTEGTIKGVPLQHGTTRSSSMQIVTASGRHVDLCDLRNIRKGMVFQSDKWRHPDAPDGILTMAWHNGRDTWTSTGQLHCCPHLAERYLGCDPAVATQEDCEEYGVASPEYRSLAAGETVRSRYLRAKGEQKTGTHLPATSTQTTYLLP